MVKKCEEVSSSNPRRSGLNHSNGEKMFRSKNVHKQDGEVIGKKQDKLGRACDRMPIAVKIMVTETCSAEQRPA